MNFARHLKAAAAAMALCAGLIGAADARDATVYSATLGTPVERLERVIAGSAVWRCEGASCVTASETRFSTRVCRELGRRVGYITAFGAAENMLSAEDLATCNGDRPAPAAPAPEAAPAAEPAADPVAAEPAAEPAAPAAQ